VGFVANFVRFPAVQKFNKNQLRFDTAIYKEWYSCFHFAVLAFMNVLLY